MTDILVDSNILLDGGAHAAVPGTPLVTRDAGRYRTYFPKLELVVP